MEEHEHQKANILPVAITAIIAIVLIVFLTIDNPGASTVMGEDSVGNAAEVLSSQELQDIMLCKLFITKTDGDETALSTVLAKGDSSYYAGFALSVEEINSNGCIVNINGNSDYVVVGQIQRVGPLYVTVREVLK
ncbi:MAG: hypothetical protein ACP5NW_03275 [Candidatus Woesearchaeota archaeon]